jgi:hypothetical protein
MRRIASIALLPGHLMGVIRYAGFTVAALVGFAIQTNAEMPCPELERLRSEATEAWNQVERDPVSVRCRSYHRFVRADEATVEYAHSNHESCGFSAQSLEQMEMHHRMAVRDRNNFCAGRQWLKPFTPW